MWKLAIKSMLGDRGKLLTCLLGVVFSVSLINLQAGLLMGLIHKASLLIDNGQADIWIGDRFMNDVETGGVPIPERWLHRVRGMAGVERADAYLLHMSTFTNPDGRRENVVVVGCDPASLLGNPTLLDVGQPGAIRHTDAVLVDVCDQQRLGDCQLGDMREIGNHRAKIVGFTRGLVGFTTRPYVFTSLDRARSRFCVDFPRDSCSYILVKVTPGTDVTELTQRIRERLPRAAVYDRWTYAGMSMWYWFTRTGIGISFGLATLLGLIVGLGVVAQTLYASVVERIKEFGTLKALGADCTCIARFVFTQALGNAVVGSALGLVFSLTLGCYLSSPRAPIEWCWWMPSVSVVLVTAVCGLAGWLPYWRISRIDPASVLRG